MGFIEGIAIRVIEKSASGELSLGDTLVFGTQTQRCIRPQRTRPKHRRCSTARSGIPFPAARWVPSEQKYVRPTKSAEIRNKRRKDGTLLINNSS